MRANQVLPFMLAGTAGCLDLQALQSDAKDAALPPVEDMALSTNDMAMKPADMAVPAKDMTVIQDMTAPPVTWTQQHKITNINLYALHGKTVGAETTIWAVGDNSKSAYYTTTANKWTSKDMDGAKDKTFRGLWAASEKVVWAVADGGFIYKGDNAGGWAALTSNVTTNLSGIFGNSGTDILVSGADTAKFLASTDGTAWTALTHNQTSASTGMWVTGTLTFASAPAGVAIRGSDRSTWSLETTQAATTFNSVSGFDDKNVYTVGNGGYIAKWDSANTKWVPTKVDVAGRDFLSVWAISATDVWAVGKTGMAYRNDGTKWNFVGPTAIATYDLRAVWGDAKGVYVAAYDPGSKDSFIYKY